jgi:pro-apoptotic serine protease NMA111
MSSQIGLNKPSNRVSISEIEHSSNGLLIPEYFAETIKQGHQTIDAWGKVLQHVIKAIVSIKVTVLRAFDTENAGSFEGTGFVVDRTRGIILSNRHIVTSGPITATATFGNYEEITLTQDYFDPVHDFGFFRYDPAKIKFAEVEEIELYPEGAKVGLDIKVCGNDAGEKLSILSAILARLDRAAPSYGPGYNDFNINYLQAASGTSSGSSGSPVLDVEGRAIALNAGGRTDSASSFYLPLEPVVHALKYVQQSKPVPRGTLQTVFVHSSYDELKRLGFPELIEKKCRENNKDGTGLLSISKILPKGPGYNSGLAVGDVLIECYEQTFGRRLISRFHPLWEIIDDSVGKEITLTIYRGPQKKEITIIVQDLHSITPNEFLEIGGGIFHPLSYQLAMAHHMPCKGIFSADSGVFDWAGSSGGFIITQLAGKPVESIEQFGQIYLSIPDGKRVGFRYMKLGGRDQLHGIVEIDHHFYASAQFNYNGTWKRKILSLNPIDEPDPLKRVPTSPRSGFAY